MCRCTEDELREMNWSLFSGETGREAVRDFSTLNLAPPDHDLYESCKIAFSDVLPHVFPAMCDTYRRLVLPALKEKTQLLGIGRLTGPQAAQYWLSWRPNRCVASGILLSKSGP